MTSTRKKELFLFVKVVSLIIIGFTTVAIVGSVLKDMTALSPEEQKRQDFVDGCKYYSNGAPDTSGKVWRCVK